MVLIKTSSNSFSVEKEWELGIPTVIGIFPFGGPLTMGVSHAQWKENSSRVLPFQTIITF